VLIKLAGITVFSLLLLMVTPAFADVTSVNLEKSFYIDDENFVFEGTESTGQKTVHVIINDPRGKFVTIVSDPSSDKDGKFATLPQSVDSFFDREGTYEIIAFTDKQKKENGITLQLVYNNNKLSVVQDRVLSLKSIPDKTVEVEKTVSFTASITDNSIDDLVFILGNKDDFGATIDSSSGKFVWTPTKSHGNIQDVHYIFEIIVNNGVQEDRETIIITVKQAYVEPEKKSESEVKTTEPIMEPEPTESEELGLASFVDESKDPQSYVERYNTEASYKEWFDENYSEYDSIYQAVGLEKPVTETIAEPEFGECGKGTEFVDGMCIVVENKGGGGCLIATATYGSEMAPQVQYLREIRDNQLMSTESGVSFMTGFNEFYYSFSPYIADMERESPAFKEAVKIGLTPLLSSLSIMSYAESESEVLGYGIGVILANIGMYVAAPAMLIYGIRKVRRVRF